MRFIRIWGWLRPGPWPLYLDWVTVPRSQHGDCRELSISSPPSNLSSKIDMTITNPSIPVFYSTFSILSPTLTNIYKYANTMSESHPPTTQDQTPLPPQNQPENLTTNDNLNEPNLDETTNAKNLPIKTHHCRFCNHLLLATTRSLFSLPRRKDPARDAALILPLPRTTNDDEDETDQNDRVKGVKHYSILLSTSIPDRKATLVRREDGFEKRLFLRCGRCRVVVGYFLDDVHFPGHTENNGDEGAGAKVVYLLPGGLVETGIMGDEEKIKAMDQEWGGWE